MEVGELVIFNGEKYIIQWIYVRGYCEIKHLSSKRIELVHVSEIKLQKKQTN